MNRQTPGRGILRSFFGSLKTLHVVAFSDVISGSAAKRKKAQWAKKPPTPGMVSGEIGEKSHQTTAQFPSFFLSFCHSPPHSPPGGCVWWGWWVDEEKEEDRDIRLFREGKKCSL